MCRGAFAPDEIVTLCFTYLTGIGLMRSEWVCRHWQRLATNDSLWEKLFYRDHLDSIIRLQSRNLSMQRNYRMRSQIILPVSEGIPQLENVGIVPSDRRIKVIVMGPRSSGKTALVERFKKKQFPDLTNAGGDGEMRLRRAVFLLRGVPTQMDIIDMKESCRPSPLSGALLSGQTAVLGVVDSTDEHGLSRLVEVMDERHIRQRLESIPTVLVLTKVDSADRCLTRQRLDEFAFSRGISFVETSSLSGRGVELVFALAAQLLHEGFDPETRVG